MTYALATLFRQLFTALVVVMALGVAALAGLTYANTSSALLASAVAVAGFLSLIALFGVVALQIENNLLLHRIAAATESGPKAPRATTPPDPKRPEAPILAANRAPPAPRAGPANRIEPVVSLTRAQS